MGIKVTNDGKNKAQSYEAEIELDSNLTYWGYYTSKFTGYGANEWSAKMNLIQQVDDLLIELNKLKDDIK